MRDAFTVTAPRARLDWHGVRRQVDLPTLAEALLGPPSRREGARSLWRCPFHDERSPSFVLERGRHTWKCFGCGEHGDAADLVGKLEHLEFPESARRAAEIVGLYIPESGEYQPPKPKAYAPPPPPPPTGLDQSEGMKLIEEAEVHLWTDAGAPWLKYLREDRGLEDETIRGARLGWAPRVNLRTRDDRAYWASGITIPWFNGDRLGSIKLRRTDGRDPKYLEILRDQPQAFPSLEMVRPGFPLVIVEGEFDALLLGQELDGHATVITVGSASNALKPSLFRNLLPANPWYIAVDADQAGEKFAKGWPAHARRVRPFDGSKDWSDLHRTGHGRIRYQWGGIIPSFRPSWPELEAQRWGQSPGLAQAPTVNQNPRNPQNLGSDEREPGDDDDAPTDPAWLAEFSRLQGPDDPSRDATAADLIADRERQAHTRPGMAEQEG